MVFRFAMHVQDQPKPMNPIIPVDAHAPWRTHAMESAKKTLASALSGSPTNRRMVILCPSWGWVPRVYKARIQIYEDSAVTMSQRGIMWHGLTLTSLSFLSIKNVGSKQKFIDG